MADGGTSRPTQKLDPQELLGLVALTSGKERLRPTCEMPKLELTKLLHDPVMGRAAPLPTPTPEAPLLAKGSSGIAAIPKMVVEAARLADLEASASAVSVITPLPTPTHSRTVVILASCATTIAAIAGVIALL